MDMLGRFFVGIIMAVSSLFQKNALTRIVCVVGFTSFSVLVAASLMPKAEYLPQGNQNIILNILVPPPGYSAKKRHEVGEYVYKRLEPYQKEDGKDGLPQVDDVFYISADMFSMFGTTCTDAHETETKKLIPTLFEIIHSIPDMFGVSIQPGIFESEFAKGRTVDVNISGETLQDIVGAGGMLFGALRQAVPGAQIRPVPSLEMSYPECNIVPDKRKLAASGLTETDLGIYVDVLMKGREIDEYRPDGGYQIDLVVRGEDSDFKTPEDIIDCSIANNSGRLIRIGDVAHLEYTSGMTQIDHLEKRRNIRLEVTPPETLALQTAMETIEELISGLKASGTLQNVSVRIGGNADKLVETRKSLQWNFLLALMITYLLMSALFENFFYPLIIMFSVAARGRGRVHRPPARKPVHRSPAPGCAHHARVRHPRGDRGQQTPSSSCTSPSTTSGTEPWPGCRPSPNRCAPGSDPSS